MGQALATQDRLRAQSLDTGARGGGNKARRRAAALPFKSRGDGHRQGLTRHNRTKSRAQQRLLFARYGDAAKKWTSRGRYTQLPERV